MIIAVAGGKGGTGKSTVAFNLARELDAAVVVDGDITDPDLPRGAGPTLHAVLAGRTNPTAAVAEHAGVPLLPCGRTLEGARAVDLGAIGDALDSLHRQYNHVVVDCPPGLARDVGVELESADIAVAVTNPDRAALDAVAETRDLAADLGTSVAAVALNRADPEAYTDLVADIESTIGAPVTAIPRRLEVTDTRHATPVRNVHPDSPVCAAFETLAQQVRRVRSRN